MKGKQTEIWLNGNIKTNDIHTTIDSIMRKNSNFCGTSVENYDNWKKIGLPGQKKVLIHSISDDGFATNIVLNKSQVKEINKEFPKLIIIENIQNTKQIKSFKEKEIDKYDKI